MSYQLNKQNYNNGHSLRKKTVNYGLVILVLIAAWLMYFHLDWVVAGYPKVEASPTPINSAQPIQGVDAQPKLETAPASEPAPAPAEKPKTYWTQPSVDQYGTPVDSVQATASTGYHRADGFDNMCFKLDGGGYAVSVVKDYDKSDPRWFPYLGDVDVATGSAATAVDSEQWCADHSPAG